MIDWEELVRDEGPAVWRTCRRLLRNQADAEESFQETFLAALQLAARQEVRNWGAMLQRIAAGRAIDRLRRRVSRAERGNDLANLAADAPSPADQAEANELAETIRRMLGELPAPQSEIFYLAELEGWTYQQIGEAFSMTSNAVGVLLHRTRNRLRTALTTTLERQA